MELRRAWPWRRILSIAILLIVVQAALLLYWFQSPRHVNVAGPNGLSAVPGETQVHASHPLGANDCNAKFPDLYYEIERASVYWKNKKHAISKDDVDISWHPTGMFEGGAIRFLIHENKVRVLESINAMLDPKGSIGERGTSFLHLLQRALESATASGEVLPTIEASIVLQDVSSPPTEDGTHSFWTWARPSHDVHFNRTTEYNGETVHYEQFWKYTTFERLWLIPNFDFWYTSSIGYYTKAVEDAMQRDNMAKISKVAWRGTRWVNPDVREHLVKVTEGKPWADVMFSDTMTHENHIDIADFCKYAFTVHTEGFSYSGRLNHLLNCNSLPFIHQLNWNLHYYHLLRKDGPDQNYVDVKDDFSDLEEKVLHYLAHPEEAQRITANHIATFREHYLTADATSCYLRRLVHEYASVAFTPETTRSNIDGTTGLRGRDLDTFFAKPEDFKEP
ncbi:hypothetical protein CB0940_05860 [Cercospora beticola]|uniref:Glycosyl transferase CAP10 domain-containing protein n=1 Tax=Cercospora beticola TaxID=122368 RepID=A0A2G5HZ11_CERBT|nr:hypothetical protein CB0940_05860 [Cercospora beticola]PIA97492.1 hypothetical protein CB0940_05860 [Cercospora beticola]WPA98453.1 hypothetical protein RHO25_003065 [Cercospora beticola]CAK1359703.1 unnamed protein product [Cercospora beticola]